ncbi:MAG: DUF1002 domain-containing protein [Roseburia sp.]|nr:DUF1002 domain-containing protein [Roseburia sp.]
MRKNVKKIASLFMAVTIFLMSGIGVYASQTTDTQTSAVQNAKSVESSGKESADQAESDMKTDSANGAESDAKTDSVNEAENDAKTDSGNGAESDVKADSVNGADTKAEADTKVETGAGEVQAEVEDMSGQAEAPAKDRASEEAQNAADTQTPVVQGQVIVDENNDDVVITEKDKPYLALGADLTEEQRAIVLGIMGIDPANLDEYNVVYVTNAEEHQYLDSYVDASQIGSKAWSSVVIVEREKGSGLNISSNNITYCTVGMYKNALTTAGVTDADIIVAGPKAISGTAALVGIFKAYEEMTGEVIEDDVVDVALNELVVTGELAETIEGLTNEEVEEFIAYIKSVIAENDLSDEGEINEVIDEACDKYGVALTDEERQQIVDLLLKLTSLDIDLSGLVDYAASLYNSFKNGGNGGGGVIAAIGNFFGNIFSAIGDFFKNLL